MKWTPEQVAKLTELYPPTQSAGVNMVHAHFATPDPWRTQIAALMLTTPSDPLRHLSSAQQRVMSSSAYKKKAQAKEKMVLRIHAWLINTNRSAATQAVAERFGIQPHQAIDLLNIMKTRGLVTGLREGKGNTPMMWRARHA